MLDHNHLGHHRLQSCLRLLSWWFDRRSGSPPVQRCYGRRCKWEHPNFTVCNVPAHICGYHACFNRRRICRENAVQVDPGLHSCMVTIGLHATLPLGLGRWMAWCWTVWPTWGNGLRGRYRRPHFCRYCCDCGSTLHRQSPSLSRTDVDSTQCASMRHRSWITLGWLVWVQRWIRACCRWQCSNGVNSNPHIRSYRCIHVDGSRVDSLR